MKTKIALITGGYTGEAEVSFKSSAFVYSQLDHNKYDIYQITITKDAWFYVSDSGIKHAINKEDFTLVLDDSIVQFELAFIMVHGSPGEDGRLQSYFDLVGIPYTSCDALTSALTMNKGYTKAILADLNDLFLAKSVLLFENQRAQAVELVEDKLSLPYFVKPNAGGSSIGMTKVKVADELKVAIDKAFDAENTGSQVIVEEFVNGREFSEGIYRNVDGELVVLPATEVKTTREFFDFEAKYIPGLTEEITPADLDVNQQLRIGKILKDIYVRLNCKGMVRIDFFLENDTDKFYFIEINTIPGQTPQSLIPQQVRAAGLTEQEFYGNLIEVALKK
ncbi:D-alanine--D-alanine ligase [Sphingobacterium sp. IITKGP-BTPF85]|uniref:D-alanine--D-alanine ligase n=1 Tax=Sphingobacterium sp. IITKGP-BTPF85 TaxID=1338009 RepID=UPI00038A4657|nr:D-alanine--D-alanine ligase [Sphingobacterium sp. IITKGP-BTPF85]KKX49091.1 D-alanine--D-alanine ligase [Sphingobacterium sp. IITKGP-BTPF85]